MTESPDPRLSWDEYFMSITRLVAQRATCLRRKVGAILVRDKRIISTGYNGAPSRISHCLEVGCLREARGVPSGERHELCRGLHAEQNAIIQAALHGVSTQGSTIYVTHQPCLTCAKMIINAGIERVVYAGNYPDENSRKFLEEAGLTLVHQPWDRPGDTVFHPGDVHNS